eukprot:m.307277 g.307277  ORF g.307277 m.307277 type:complete len:380 (+) comp42103_c0_seq1:16-1155(+)
MAEARLEQLQKTVVKAREELTHMDENIKKVTGRDPSEFRRFQGFARGGRRRSFRDGNEFPPAKRMAGVETSSDQPVSVVSSVVKAPSENIGDRLQKLADGGTLGQQTGMEPDENKPVIPSSVVARPDRARRESVSERDEDKKRNRRMFGSLMGTLKKFKTDSQHDSAKMQHRLQLEAKIDEEHTKEKELASQERRKLYVERRAKKIELGKLEYQTHMAELGQVWEVHGLQLSSGDFIRLKTAPPIFYKPGKHTEATSKLVEETKQAIQAEAVNLKKEVEIMIADREVASMIVESKEAEEEEEKNGEGVPTGKGSGDGKGEGGPEEDDVLMRNVGEETEGMLGEEEGEGNQGDGIGEEEERVGTKMDVQAEKAEAGTEKE